MVAWAVHANTMSNAPIRETIVLKQRLAPARPTRLLAGILSVAGYLAYLAAAQVLPLAPVSALRESSVIFGTVIGAILLREGFAAHCSGDHGDLWRRGHCSGRRPMITWHSFSDWVEPHLGRTAIPHSRSTAAPREAAVPRYRPRYFPEPGNSYNGAPASC
jgi:hypothetical protein